MVQGSGFAYLQVVRQHMNFYGWLALSPYFLEHLCLFAAIHAYCFGSVEQRHSLNIYSYHLNTLAYCSNNLAL